MRKHRLAAFAAIILLLSGCKTFVNMETRRAADLNGSIPLTSEAQPWEIALGVYLKGGSFSITDVMFDENRSGILWLCCSQSQPPIIALETAKPAGADEFGPYFVEKTDAGPVNPHRDFLLGMLAAGGIGKDQLFTPPTGGTYTLEIFAKRAQRELSPKEILASPHPAAGKDGNELGWTLLALSRLTDLDAQWTNRLGEKLTAGDILRAATSREIGWGSCGGAHELIGMADMLTAYEANHSKLKGEWLNTRNYLDRAIETARKNQAETGGFGPEWFKNKTELDNPIDVIYHTGHVLDWLIPALPPERLSEPWVKKSVSYLAEVMNLYMDQLTDYPEYSFHAAHALKTYLHRTNPPARSDEKWLSKDKPEQPCPFLYCR